MKRKLLMIVLLVAGGSAGYLSLHKKTPPPPSVSDMKKLPPPWKSPQTIGKELAPVPQPTEKVSPPPVEKKKSTGPLKVYFDTPNAPKLNEPIAVTLVVEKNLANWPADIGASPALNLLLRLPPGVKLSGEGWSPAPLPSEEKKDETGPWSLYTREETLQITADSSSLVLARIPFSLTVVEEGVNWIITARARLSQGTQVWQSFGVIFATLSQGEAAFHTIPKSNPPTTPATTPAPSSHLSDAKAN